MVLKPKVDDADRHGSFERSKFSESEGEVVKRRVAVIEGATRNRYKKESGQGMGKTGNLESLLIMAPKEVNVAESDDGESTELTQALIIEVVHLLRLLQTQKVSGDKGRQKYRNRDTFKVIRMRGKSSNRILHIGIAELLTFVHTYISDVHNQVSNSLLL
jgi:hypothetical protein